MINSSAEITGNTISGMANGLSVTSSSSPTVYGNTFSGNQYLVARSVTRRSITTIDISVTDTTDIVYTLTVSPALITGTNTKTFTGIDTKYIAEVLIGGDVVWSGRTLEQAEREFDVSQYSGLTDITFRIRRTE